MVTDEELHAVLGSVKDPDEAARILIEMANTAGGPDNITCIVADVTGAGLPEATADDVVEYALWKVVPDAPTPPPTPDEPDDLAPPERAPTYGVPGHDDSDEAELEAPTPLERWAMLAVVVLLLVALLAGAQLYRRGVECHLEASTPGLHVIDGGRDIGLRTVEGELRLRLLPGPHVVGLRSGGEEAMTAREVVVAEGAECSINFVVDHP